MKNNLIEQREENQRQGNLCDNEKATREEVREQLLRKYFLPQADNISSGVKGVDHLSNNIGLIKKCGNVKIAKFQFSTINQRLQAMGSVKGLHFTRRPHHHRHPRRRPARK